MGQCPFHPPASKPDPLSLSEQTFRVMLDSFKDCAVFTLSPEGQITTWNNDAQRLIGYAAEEIVGQSCAVLSRPDEAWRQQLDAAARDGSFRTELFRLRRDGTSFWASIILTPLRDDTAALLGFVEITRDMTERHLAQQATQDTAAQLQGVIRAAVDGIMAIDDRGHIEWLNPAALRIFGYASEELIGKNINVLMPEPYHSAHDQYLANYKRTGQAQIIGIGREVQGQRKDGSVFPLDLAVSEVRLADRRMYTGIVRDITERKVAERSLLEAKNAAESANSAKDLFLAMVSHELRTPLNPIVAAVSLLEQHLENNPEIREEVAIIRRNVEHEAQLVDDLLNLTRLARGKIELHTEVVDVHALLRALLNQCESAIDEKNIELATALRAKSSTIWADPTRIRQVLMNLLDNAIKFSFSGGQISVRTTNVDNHLRIEIADTGIGIESQTLARLFTPFEQGEKTIARQYGGLGLGLAISKGIVDLHGGALSATSPGKDKGATFVLTLATVPVAEDDEPTSAHPDAAIRGLVLLVEDHQDTLRLMSKLLKSLGYRVFPATTVREALRLADTENFDVLVSDIGLPDGSGLDVLREIRRHHAIKAIAVSGFGQPEDLSRSREAGFVDHLVKPINFARLESALKQIMNN